MYNTCLICLENNAKQIKQINCNCKLYIHNSCFEKCKKNGIYCPICRRKEIIISNFERNNTLLYYLEIPIKLLLFSYPSFISFILYFIYNFIITVFCIFPIIIINIIITKFGYNEINELKSLIIFYFVIFIK